MNKIYFDDFIKSLKETNATLDYFVNFKKVKYNVDQISLKLHQLNYLLGKDNLKQAINDLFIENPSVFNILDILIAIRCKTNKLVINEFGNYISINEYFKTPDGVFKYIQDTGLEPIFKDNTITNLVDYVFGIEVGLDTNARKNRGGENMSKIVKFQFDSAKIKYETEISSKRFSDILTLGADIKRFDFVIRTETKIYLIEVNFYNTGGSKLNEVARAYTELNEKLKGYDNYSFVWITDGKGWLSAKNKLEEAYNSIEHLYNLSTLNEFILTIKK